MQNRKLFPLILALVALASHPLQAQQWTQKPTDEKITLVDSAGTRTTLDPGVASPFKVTMTGLLITTGAKWEFQIQGSKADAVVATPAYIDLERIIPKKRQLVIELVRLTSKDGTRTWVMETTKSGFFAAGSAEVFAQDKRPSATRADDGHWRIAIPTALAPGEYAVVSDGDYWDFTVK